MALAAAPPTVLVVEDDASMREAIARLLGVAGFAPVTYTSAEALLAAGSSERAACIVSDLRLPALSGLGLLEALRGRRCRTPLVLITAYDEPGLGERATRLGAAGYLVKPFHGTALLAAVKASIEAGRAG